MLVLYLFSLFFYIGICQSRPVIGILSLPSGFKSYSSSQYSYIFTSYVQYLESQGASTVVIKYTWSDAKLLSTLKQINGLLIPGGGANLIEKNGRMSQFATKGHFLIEAAIALNREGYYFPVWGTCLGFELMLMKGDPSSNKILSLRDGQNHLGGVHLITDKVKESRMMSVFSED